MNARVLAGQNTMTQRVTDQSRRMSLVEAATNVIVGYVLAVGMQILIFPMFGIQIALGDQLSIGIAFTGVSLIRGYMLRRLFERWR